MVTAPIPITICGSMRRAGRHDNPLLTGTIKPARRSNSCVSADCTLASLHATWGEKSRLRPLRGRRNVGRNGRIRC